MIHCLLLSAGESSRFGTPKALARLGEETIMGRLLKVLISSNVDGISVVLGYADNLIQPFILNHRKVNVVYNKDHKFGQTSSFLAGLRALDSKTEAVLLLPVDYPLVKTQTINTLIECYHEKKPQIIIPAFQGQKGHPPLFGMSLKQEFLALQMDQGINSVAHRHQETTTVLEMDDPGVIRSFNTPQDFDEIKKQIN